MAEVGRVEPRLATAPPLDDGDVARIDERARKYLGSGLDEWQAVWLRHLTGTREDGFPAAEAACIVSRQNGKSWAMLALILDRLLEGKRIVACAQRVNLARDQWMRIARLFDPVLNPDAPLQDLLAHADKSRGNEQLDLRNGGYYRVVAATENAARGLDAIDLLWMDEVRAHKSWDAYAALAPITTVSEAPQIVMTSNAGHGQSVVLNSWRDRGRKAVSGVVTDDPIVWLEWSADPSRDIDDREGWAEANPNLGRRFRVSAIERDYRTWADDPDKFRTERLCQWVEAMGAAIDVHAWGRLADLELPAPDPEQAGLMLAVGVDPYRRGAVIMLGHQLPDGRTAMGMLRSWELEPGWEVSDKEIADAIVEEWEKWRPRRIGFNSYVAASVVHLLSRRRLPLLDLKGKKYFDSCALLHELVKTGRLVHDGDELVTRHVGQAVREDLRNGDGWYLSRRRSPGPIYGADAAAMLAWLTSRQHGNTTGVVTLAG